jgi:hypothetical protein
MSTEKNNPPSTKEVELFLKEIDFNLPTGFLEFFKEANGAELSTQEDFILLWPLTDMVQLNREYNVEEYAPGFFVFGSNGGDTAYAIQRNTGNIFELPFIGMSKEEAKLKSKNFAEFIEKFN